MKIVHGVRGGWGQQKRETVQQRREVATEARSGSEPEDP